MVSSDAPIVRGYGNMMVMQSFIPAVRNAQKQYGLRVREIMAKVTHESGPQKEVVAIQDLLQKMKSIRTNILPIGSRSLKESNIFLG
jgi:hypothetical protein